MVAICHIVVVEMLTKASRLCLLFGLAASSYPKNK